VRYGAPRESLVNGDREADLREHAERVDAREVRRRLMVLEEALRSIEGAAGTGMPEPTWPEHSAARTDY
jgi:hypothetical protein